MRRHSFLPDLVQYLAFLLACLMVIASPRARGDEEPLLPTQVVDVTVNELGDAHATVRIRASEALRADWQANAMTGDVLLRWMKLDNFWLPQTDVKLRYGDPDPAQVSVTYTIPGLARRNGAEWEILLQSWGDSSTVKDGKLVTTAIVDSALGRMRRVTRFEFPGAQGEPRLLRQEKAFVTLPAPAAKSGDAVTTTPKLEVTPQIMGCMAKSYGYEKFPKLWLARTIMKNTGSTPVTDYRVRFRLSEYASEWSLWNKTATIYPGQTVVDAYFPLLNIEKIASLQGRRQAALEAEYEYKLADGKVVREIDGQKLEILGKNERIKSNLTPEEARNFFDRNVFVPFVIASFVTKDDPVMQMVAGRVSGQGKGVLAPASYPEHTVEFAKQVYRFILHNKIAYQTPPGVDLVQHYKYGRQVLENRAGTCVDLAMFYASVFEAVGLEPVLIMPPGHAFPMVRIPPFGQNQTPDEAKESKARFFEAYGKLLVKDDDGQYYLPIEATFVTPGVPFEKAAARGKQEFEELTIKVIEKGKEISVKKPYGRVDIVTQRREGVYALELPDIGASVLEQQWKIFAAPKAGGGDAPAAASDVPPSQRILGNWRADVPIAGQTFYILSNFRNDGTNTAMLFNMMNQQVATGDGNWTLSDAGAYRYTSALFTEDADIRFLDDNTFVYTCKTSTNPNARPGSVTTNRRVK